MKVRIVLVLFLAGICNAASVYDEERRSYRFSRLPNFREGTSAIDEVRVNVTALWKEVNQIKEVLQQHIQGDGSATPHHHHHDDHGHGDHYHNHYHHDGYEHDHHHNDSELDHHHDDYGHNHHYDNHGHGDYHQHSHDSYEHDHRHNGSEHDRHHDDHGYGHHHDYHWHDHHHDDHRHDHHNHHYHQHGDHGHHLHSYEEGGSGSTVDHRDDHRDDHVYDQHNHHGNHDHDHHGRHDHGYANNSHEEYSEEEQPKKMCIRCIMKKKMMKESGMDKHHHHHHHAEDHHYHNPVGSYRHGRGYSRRYPQREDMSEAVCHVAPNVEVPESNVTGSILISQRKGGKGPVYFDITLQGLQVTKDGIGRIHGFHIHESEVLDNQCSTAGHHFNPTKSTHGPPHSLIRHAGDLGNIKVDEHGDLHNHILWDNKVSFLGPNSILSKSIVLHAFADDFGKGGDEESLKTGNAGPRLACCTILPRAAPSIRFNG